MAYNSGFPVGYQSYYPQTFQAPQTPSFAAQGQSGNSLIWVQGEAGAKSYLVAPNCTVTLWDSENPVVYLKSADASGMPSMKILDYQIRTEAATGPSKVFSAQSDINPYKEQLNGLQAQIDALRKDIESLKGEGHEQSAI